MQFSSDDVILRKLTADAKRPFRTAHEVDRHYEIVRCARWIRTNSFRKVCLQFPDYLLTDSCAVALRLQEELNQTVYVLGDTSYESCCVDYVAASYVDADAVVHFGDVCFSECVGDVPHLEIYEKWDCDVERLKACVGTFTARLLVLLDTQYLHLTDRLRQDLDASISLRFVHDARYDAKNCSVLYVGGNKKKLAHLSAILPCDGLFYYDPKENETEIVSFKIDSRMINRRYFLAETIKDAKTVGIVVGTLAVKNYLRVIDRMKNLLAAHEKKYYIVSVGKLTVAKLANFPEMDVYVLISCSMCGAFDSRDFYRPVVAPFDVEIALNQKPLDTPFSLDYNRYLDLTEPIKTPDESSDVSLITGKIRTNREETAQIGSDVALKGEGTVAVVHGATYLRDRSWKGLERDLGRTEARRAEDGRKGTAFAYDDEPL